MSLAAERQDVLAGRSGDLEVTDQVLAPIWSPPGWWLPVLLVSGAGVGLFASPHHWEGQADDWTMAAQVDFYGTSFYPKHSAFVDRDVPWRGALLDFTRSFGFDQGRRGFYVGELQGGFGTIALNVE